MENQKERFAELDFIRFFAALSVVVYHYKSKYIESLGNDSALAQSTYAVTKFGYLGVDLFFIVSGFVIFSSALGRTGFQFAVSRITRIYPTFWVCVSITAVLSLLLRGEESGITAWRWLANLTLLNGAVGIEDIDGVYWTLVVELKFYFCILALLLLNWLQHYRIWIPLWLLATITFLLMKQPFFLGWFISPEYSSYFISGIIFYLVRRDGYRLFHVAMLVPALVTSSAYARRAIDTFARDVSEVDRLTVVAIVCALFLLFLLVSTRKFTPRNTGFVLGLGGMTYPLYLLHNRAGKEIYDALADSVPPLVLAIAIAAAMMVASWAIHVYLERGIADRLKYQLFGMASRISALRSKQSSE